MIGSANRLNTIFIASVHVVAFAAVAWFVVHPPARPTVALAVAWYWCSGLSITEWKPIHGVIPPLSAEEWEEEFRLYQRIPQYEQLNKGMTVAEFKTIFWWEWAHRLLARRYDRGTANATALLLALSPWVIFMSAELMPHPLSVALPPAASNRRLRLRIMEGAAYDIFTRPPGATAVELGVSIPIYLAHRQPEDRAHMKRIFLLVATNFAVLIVLSITMQLLGVDQMLAQGTGINLYGLLLMAAIFGFGGSFISLLISKWMAKMAVGAHVIEVPSNMTERWLVDTVKRQADKAGIGMPEVAIYDAPDINAFATGWNRDNALVAVSTGLLQNMSHEEAEAVLGHEVSHVANGDMVTLTLIQGVLNTFVIFLSRVIGFIVDRVVFKVERGQGPAFFITVIVAQIVLGILASMIVMWFSRWREFRADAGGAHRVERGVVRIVGPDASAHWPKNPHQVPALRSELDEFIGIRGIRHYDLVAVDAERKRAESLQTLQCLRAACAGPRASRSFRSRNVPRAQFPPCPHGRAVHREEAVPALVQLQSGTWYRRVGDRLRLLDRRQLFLDEAMPVQRQNDRCVRIRHGGERDAHQRQAGCGNLVLDAIQNLHGRDLLNAHAKGISKVGASTLYNGAGKAKVDLHEAVQRRTAMNGGRSGTSGRVKLAESKIRLPLFLRIPDSRRPLPRENRQLMTFLRFPEVKCKPALAAICC